MCIISLSTKEQRALLDDIHRRNRIRESAGLPLLDAQQEYTRALSQRQEAQFRHHLQPYINQALSEIPEAPGWIAHVIRQHRAMKIARERLMANAHWDDLAFR